MVREHNIKVLMIDYLQLMNANGMRFNSRQEEVSTISRSLKGLAKELDIPILALSQLSRAVEQRDPKEGRRPQLSDLRESGAIEQDADMVLLCIVQNIIIFFKTTMAMTFMVWLRLLSLNTVRVQQVMYYSTSVVNTHDLLTLRT